jgi:hypothetical protein
LRNEELNQLDKTQYTNKFNRDRLAVAFTLKIGIINYLLTSEKPQKKGNGLKKQKK